MLKTKINWRRFFIFCGVFLAVFVLDRILKSVMLAGFSWDSPALTIGGHALVFNSGVAFSMFAFLGDSLKFIQLILLCVLCVFLVGSEAFKAHFVAFGMLLAGGASNVLDRFLFPGVVDYIFWHYGFEFAIFNFADIAINVAVALILLRLLVDWRASCNKQKTNI